MEIDKQKIVAIIQARMGSSRLPGKILKPLVGEPVLWHVYNRLTYAKQLDQIVVATTEEEKDNAVEQFCLENNIPCFRGSQEDVLDRYYQAAKKFNADYIVRITADCPVIDPVIVDEVVTGFLEGGYDVYGLAGEFPDGLDCGAFTFQTLEDTWKNAKLPSEREHVSTYMSKHPQKFHLGVYKKFNGLSHHRWTLDEESDYRFLGEVFTKLYNPNKIFLTQDILTLLEQEPRLIQLNNQIRRNEGYYKSLLKDKKYLKEKQR